MAASIDDFCVDGFLVVRGAVAADVVSACVDIIENELRARGVEPRDPGTWIEPVVRFPCPDGAAFTVAGKSPATWPHLGAGPRMIAQPEIGHREPFALREGIDVSAVERAILCGLQQ